MDNIYYTNYNNIIHIWIIKWSKNNEKEKKNY